MSDEVFVDVDVAFCIFFVILYLPLENATEDALLASIKWLLLQLQLLLFLFEFGHLLLVDRMLLIHIHKSMNLSFLVLNNQQKLIEIFLRNESFLIYLNPLQFNWWIRWVAHRLHLTKSSSLLYFCWGRFQDKFFRILEAHSSARSHTAHNCYFLPRWNLQWPPENAGLWSIKYLQ